MYARKYLQYVYIISIGVYYTNTKHLFPLHITLSEPHTLFQYTVKTLASLNDQCGFNCNYTQISSEFSKPLTYEQNHTKHPPTTFCLIIDGCQGSNCVLTWHMNCANQKKWRNWKSASAFKKQKLYVYESVSVCLCVNVWVYQCVSVRVFKCMSVWAHTFDKCRVASMGH